MKKIYNLLTITFLFLSATIVNAQDNIAGLIKSNPSDAAKLISAYAKPLFKGFGLGQNSGWNNTAKAKKLLHFDLRISASAAFVPASDKSFDVTKIGLSSHIGPANPTQTIAPTFAGNKDISGPLLNVYDDNHKQVGQFNIPAGRIAFIPAPQVQITAGLIDNTDVTVRTIPKINFDGTGSASMFGFGFKHDIMQDIVGKTADDLIPFDLALAFGYSHLNLDVPVNVNADDNAQPASSSQNSDFSNQHIKGSFNSFMLQAIISKKLLFFTPFFSVGYNNTHTRIDALGNYPFTTGYNTYTTYTNPVSLSESSVNGIRADLGFQLNLGFFRIYASGSLAQYKSADVGIGFGF